MTAEGVSISAAVSAETFDAVRVPANVPCKYAPLNRLFFHVVVVTLYTVRDRVSEQCLLASTRPLLPWNPFDTRGFGPGPPCVPLAARSICRVTLS